MENLDIEQMRKDFQAVVSWRKENDGWTDSDCEDLGEQIKSAIEREDWEIANSYANWLRTEAAEYGK